MKTESPIDRDEASVCKSDPTFQLRFRQTALAAK